MEAIWRNHGPMPMQWMGGFGYFDATRCVNIGMCSRAHFVYRWWMVVASTNFQMFTSTWVNSNDIYIYIYIKMSWNHHVVTTTFPKTNIACENRSGPKRKGSCPNQHFSGARWSADRFRECIWSERYETFDVSTGVLLNIFPDHFWTYWYQVRYVYGWSTYLPPALTYPQKHGLDTALWGNPMVKKPLIRPYLWRRTLKGIWYVDWPVCKLCTNSSPNKACLLISISPS